MERSRSWPRSIWPPRSLCQSRNSLACSASASRQNRSTALFLVNSTIPSRLRFRCAHPTRHTAHHRQIGDQRRQLWAEVPQGFLWHRRPRALAALWTDYPIALIFDDASLDGWQLGHWMPLHRAGGLHLLDLRRQGLAAMLALLRQQGPHLVDPFGWYQRPMRSAMAGLSTRLPA